MQRFFFFFCNPFVSLVKFESCSCHWSETANTKHISILKMRLNGVGIATNKADQNGKPNLKQK